MLLHREKHMVDKYGDRGHCWSLFLKACLDNNSIKIHSSLIDKVNPKSELRMLADMVNRYSEGVSLPEPHANPGIHYSF